MLMRTETLVPAFLEGDRGRLFCLFGARYDSKQSSISGQRELLSETHNKHSQHIVLFLPPFGEEVNLCRRFYSSVRRKLIQGNAVTVQPDLYGTGDSAGLLEDATWDIWQEDLRCVLQQVGALSEKASHPVELSILAVRAGCLMIQNVIRTCEQEKIPVRLRNLVMVQPEHHGEEVVNRLFRARTMAQRLGGDKSQNSQDLWDQIERGVTVHAGGHSLSPQLCQSMRDRRLHSLMISDVGTHRIWFDLSTRASASSDALGAATTWTIEFHIHTPFWQSYDLEADEPLFDAVASAVLR